MRRPTPSRPAARSRAARRGCSQATCGDGPLRERGRGADRDARAGARSRASRAACCRSTCSTRSARSSCACASRSRPSIAGDERIALRPRLHVIGVLGYDRALRAGATRCWPASSGSSRWRGPSRTRPSMATGGSVGGASSKLRLRARCRRSRRRRRGRDPAAPAGGRRAQPARHAAGHRLGVPARPARRGAPHARAAARAARRLRARAAARLSRRLQGAAADHGPDARPRRAAAGVRRARRRAAGRRAPTSRRCAGCWRTASSPSGGAMVRALQSDATRALLDNWS